MEVRVLTYLFMNISLSTNLLVLERKLDEYLLELLVDEVDAELLEPILLEYLEPVNVEDTEAIHALHYTSVLHRSVYTLK